MSIFDVRLIALCVDVLGCEDVVEDFEDKCKPSLGLCVELHRYGLCLFGHLLSSEAVRCLLLEGDELFYFREGFLVDRSCPTNYHYGYDLDLEIF